MSDYHLHEKFGEFRIVMKGHGKVNVSEGNEVDVETGSVACFRAGFKQQVIDTARETLHPEEALLKRGKL